jgi:hypothetical protein
MGNKRMFTAVFGGVSVSAAQDFFELNAPSDACVVLYSAFIGQSSVAGDSSADIARIQVKRATTTGGTGGTPPTARPLEVGDSAFGGSVEINNTVQAGGTVLFLIEETFNVQSGWFYKPDPDERIVLSPSGRLVISTPDTLTLTMSGTIVFEELGG